MIAQSLGVSWGYQAATAERGSGKPEPTKDVARAMIAMTRDIKGEDRDSRAQPATSCGLVPTTEV